MTSRHRVPLWLMGLTNLTYGMYEGIIAYAILQLLSGRDVPESDIASLTAVAFTPGWWAFLFSPVLDVRFSRRGYAMVLACVEALTLFVSFMNLGSLSVLKVSLTTGFFAAFLFQSARRLALQHYVRGGREDAERLDYGGERRRLRVDGDFL